MSSSTLLTDKEIIPKTILSKPVKNVSTYEAIYGILKILLRNYPGEFKLILWDNTVIEWGQELKFNLIFREKSSFKKLFLHGDIFSAGKDFIENRIDIEGNIFEAIDLGNYLIKQDFPWTDKLNLFLTILKM